MWLVRAVAAALVTACVCAGAAAVAAAQLCGIETPLYYFYRLVGHPKFVAYLWPSESGVWLGQALAATWGPLFSARSAARSSSPPAASAFRCTKRTE